MQLTRSCDLLADVRHPRQSDLLLATNLHMPPSAQLLALLEYRLRAVAIGHVALRHAAAWDDPPAMEIRFNGEQVMEGKATGFTNGAIESALIHCRALLEFIGLSGGSSAFTLSDLKGRRPDDQGIELIDTLRRVTIKEAAAYYPGPAHEAEAALAYVIHLANKGLAHTSRTFTRHDEGTRLVEIAFRGVPILVVNKFYLPLGMTVPEYNVPHRKRPT